MRHKVPRLTFDTNCMIALAEKEQPAANCIRMLLELHDAGQVEVRMVASTASERQPGKTYLSNFSAFQMRLAGLGLAHIELLKPLCYRNVSFLDWAVLGGGETLKAR
jgi:hypothetical protein